MIVHYKTHLPCKVFDANGLEWHNLRWVNTETGEAEQMVIDEHGVKQLNSEQTELLTQIVHLPAPVFVTPIARRDDGPDEPDPVVWPKCRESRKQ